MFEVSAHAYMPSVGRTEQTGGYSSFFRRVPDFPLSNHGFQAFIDRLFRFAGQKNWIPLNIWTVGRTTIPSPAE
jgi:hypothetical protein